MPTHTHEFKYAAALHQVPFQCLAMTSGVKLLWLLLLMSAWCQHAQGMYHKRSLPEEDDKASAERLLRAEYDDMFLTGNIQGPRAHRLYRLSAATGNRMMKRRAKASAHKKHASRNLLQQMVKGSKWPSLYVAQVEAYSAKTQKPVNMKVNFLLPHEIIFMMANKMTNHDALYNVQGMAEISKENLSRACQELGEERLLGLGLWGDGVPCNYDRSQSMEMLCWSLPGLVNTFGLMRVPFTCINKKFFLKNKTWDSILLIMTWSLMVLASGVMPEFGHDGQRLTGKRAKWAGKPVPKTICVEIRSDWAFLKQCFRFPAHNEKAGICWMCTATPKDLGEHGADARWKQERLSHWDFLSTMYAKGRQPSPLMSAPGVTTKTFLIDWLHCADLGITADVLGSLFKYLLDKMEGTTQGIRCGNLFLAIKEFYSRVNPDSQLDNLTLKMIKKDKAKTPKLRAKAAESRYLVPFALEAVGRWLSPDDTYEATIINLVKNLHGCYENLSQEAFSADSLKSHSTKFCILYSILAQYDKTLWGLKPKLHLFAELTQMGHSCPSMFWTYRDEDFGGYIAGMSRRHGGSSNAFATSHFVLTKFRARYNLPLL